MKGFKVETGQVSFKPHQVAKLSGLQADQKAIQEKLRAHERAMQRLKILHPEMYRKLRKQGL